VLERGIYDEVCYENRDGPGSTKRCKAAAGIKRQTAQSEAVSPSFRRAPRSRGGKCSPALKGMQEPTPRRNSNEDSQRRGADQKRPIGTGVRSISSGSASLTTWPPSGPRKKSVLRGEQAGDGADKTANRHSRRTGHA